MKIYLLRHGETEYNREKRYQGTLDIPLSEKGMDELTVADFSPDRVFVSPLSRATMTAKILFPKAEIIVENDLREMCFGVFQGHNYVEMEHDPDYIAWVGADCMGRCPGGETRSEFSERSCAVFNRLVNEAFKRGDNELVIMAHGGTQMAVMERFALPKEDYYHWCSSNAGGYLLEANSEEWQHLHIVRLMETVHYIKTEVQA